MANQSICEKCSQRNGCEQVYQRMADYKGPSVLGKVLLAFAVPLLTFIPAAVIFGKLTADLASKTAATALSFVLAVGTTAIVVSAIQIVYRWFGRNR